MELSRSSQLSPLATTHWAGCEEPAFKLGLGITAPAQCHGISLPLKPSVCRRRLPGQIPGSAGPPRSGLGAEAGGCLPSVLKPWLVLPLPSDSGLRCAAPGEERGELSESRLWCAGLGTSGTLSSPSSSLLAPADSCSQGCWVCAPIFRSRLEALPVFSLPPPPPTSRCAEHPSLNLSGGGDLQESCRYWPLPQRDRDNCVQVRVRCCLSLVWERRRAMLGCHAAVHPRSQAAGDGGTSVVTLSDTGKGGQRKAT